MECSAEGGGGCAMMVCGGGGGQTERGSWVGLVCCTADREQRSVLVGLQLQSQEDATIVSRSPVRPKETGCLRVSFEFAEPPWLGRNIDGMSYLPLPFPGPSTLMCQVMRDQVCFACWKYFSGTN